MKTGVTVKWIEDRREHLLASSSGTDRIAYREVAARRDGTVLGMRYRWCDNVGGYIRSPEPGCSYRPLGNYVGPYQFQDLEVEASTVMTNKSLTGPNRGYACGHLYFETERMMDLLAAKVGLDPAEVRRRNLIPREWFPYRTPTGGLYDSGDFEATLDRALEVAKYDELKALRERARAEGRSVGIGIALAVDPSVSNMGYVATALDPQFRAKPEYLPKSGAVEACSVKIDPLGRLTAVLGRRQGQGHRTVVAQILADELGLDPADITVVDEMDTFTRVWSISSGTYSSRFGSVGTSAVALAGRKPEQSSWTMRRTSWRCRPTSSSYATARCACGRARGRTTPSRTSRGARTGTPSRFRTAWSPASPRLPSSASRRPSRSRRRTGSTRRTPTGSSPR